MATKKIAVLFGMEDTFPWALMNEIRERSNGEIEGVPVEIGHMDDELGVDYDVVVDRISHEVPFYRTWLKKAIASGCQIVNNPLWWSADDKFFDNLVAKSVGVAVPRTVVLPHKEHPPNTQEKSFRNLKWVDWPSVFSYVGFPMFMKPAYGGGWKDVYKVDTPEQFFEAYDQTHSLTMMAQEAIEFEDYYRCYVIGRESVHVMRYDPKRPHHLRYVLDGPPTEPKLLARIIRDAKALCDALGYDLNTVEFAVRDGVPIAIDFMNPAPDADLNSVGEENFRWVVENMAQVLIDRVNNPRPFELSGSWPAKFGLTTK
ncbi:MAG: hypothetical protein HYU52_03630 [Acidobacteria bacterium]|nr:hypothetical protein [Acidobacteriota bacterium]